MLARLVDAGVELSRRADDLVSHAEMNLTRVGAKIRQFGWCLGKRYTYRVRQHAAFMIRSAIRVGDLYFIINCSRRSASDAKFQKTY